MNLMIKEEPHIGYKLVPSENEIYYVEYVPDVVSSTYIVSFFHILFFILVHSGSFFNQNKKDLARLPTMFTRRYYTEARDVVLHCDLGGNEIQVKLLKKWQEIFG